jgi:hypothetical protein
LTFAQRSRSELTMAQGVQSEADIGHLIRPRIVPDFGAHTGAGDSAPGNC